MGRVNLVKNPRFHVNVTDGWTSPPTNWTATRVTSVPGVDLPAGCTAALKIEISSSATLGSTWWTLDIPVAEGSWLATTYAYLGSGAAYDTSVQVYWPGADGGGASLVSSSGFERLILDATDEATSCAAGNAKIGVYLNPSGTGDAVTLYLTGMQLEELPDDIDYDENPYLLPPYADGSSPGWVWDGTAHNSASHLISPVPKAGRPFASGFSLIATSPGGRTVDLSGVAEGFRCSGAEYGGFDTASWSQKTQYDLHYDELTPLGDVVARFDGETIFEGRITNVSKDMADNGECTRRVTARGYFDALKDDQAFIRCYVDQNLASWEDVSDGRRGFGLVTGQDDMAGINVVEGQTYVQYASDKIVYRLLSGGAPSSDKIKAFTCTLVDSIYGYGWEVDLVSRSTPSGSNIAVFWSSTGQTTYNLSFNNADLDPSDTGNVRCIVLRIRYTDSSPFSFVGMPSDPYGVKMTAYKVTSGTATTLAPEDIVADLVADHTTAGQRSFPDASGITVGQLTFSDPTTKLDAIEQVNSLLNWQYGFGPGGVFEYRQPWTAANAPDRNHYDLLWRDVSPSLTARFDDCYNRCVVRYSDRNGNPKTHTETTTSEALGALTRTASIVAPANVHGATDAEKVAEAFLVDHSEPVVTGNVPLTGSVRCIDGRERSALHAKPGDWVTFRDAPPEEERSHRIRRVELDVDRLTANVEVGREPYRLDRMMARMDMRVRKRRQ